MKIHPRYILAALLAAFLPSCAPSTPQSRIQQLPQQFERLSEKHKNLVSNGEIEEGMTPAAVSIAWGSPDSRTESFKNNSKTERWDYRGLTPVVTHNFYGGYRYGYYGHYGRHFYPGYRYGPDITYLPFRRASVWFVDGQVNKWERVR